MKKLTPIVAALLLFLAGCASSGFMDLGFRSGQPAAMQMVAIKNIATPDQAEVALFIAAKLYEAAVGALNKAHAAGLMSEANYTSVVAGANSPTRRTQRSLANAYSAIQVWRNGASREYFDREYTTVNAGVATIAKETR